jgi:hypothetical protein
MMVQRGVAACCGLIFSGVVVQCRFGAGGVHRKASGWLRRAVECVCGVQGVAGLARKAGCC